MKQKFRIYIRKHDNGNYTVTVPGVKHVTFRSDWRNWDDDERPATQRLASYGPILEEVKDDVREALEKWLRSADPSLLHRYSNWKEGQYLEKVVIEIRPSDAQGKKRRDKARFAWSLLVEKETDKDKDKKDKEQVQYLISVPKLADPPLSFYCYDLSELQETATRELSTYFSDSTLEELLEYEADRQEFLDELEVSFSPLKPQQEKKKAKEQDNRAFWALKSAGVNLSARAKDKKLEPAYKRDKEIEQMFSILSAERNNAVLLVGPSGAGKTAIVHEIARRLADERCPDELKKRKVWSTSANNLIAGCSYIGEWQEKLQNVVDECKKQRHILHVDDVIGLLEAGRWSKGDENMAQFLKPYLADGTVTLIGECTPERLRAGENQDAGFLRQFRQMEIGETKDEDTLSILGQTGANLERRFKVRITPDAAQAVLELTRRFQPYRAFPGKAVAFLERIAADAGKDENQTETKITRQYAVGAFAKYSGLPEFLIADHLTLDPTRVEKHFEERLIGQNDAVQTVTDLVAVIKSGLNDPAKPLGCYFFVGPTGVGKTEMAKALAEYLFGSADRMQRFDMSEYSEGHTVARLIGSSHGQDEGELTKRIRLQPFSVVLLDEFEKAHPSVFDVMLQVLGEGRLTDGAGRTADFRSAIVLMTSNLGASPREQRTVGIRKDESGAGGESHFRTQVEKFFRPEFVNRIDRIVTFRPLDRDAMQAIARRELGKLLEREGITRRHLLVKFDDDVIDLLLETGFSPHYGARPLKREIERRLIVPLARYLVAHKISGSHLIHIARNGNEIQLSSTNLDTPAGKMARVVKAKSTPLDGDISKVPLEKLVEGFADLRRRLHDWDEGGEIREIRNESRLLLNKTKKKNFVQFGEEAHQTWGRIYHLERLTKRLNQLRERVEYLEEFAVMVSREQDVRRSTHYKNELAAGFENLTRDVEYLEIELLCAHLKESGQAVLRLRRIGRAVATGGSEPGNAPFLMTLTKMYGRWAKRKGYECEIFLPLETYKKWIEAQNAEVKTFVPEYEASTPEKPESPAWAKINANELPALLKRLDEVAQIIEPAEIALSFRGVNVFGFLQGEAGTHKLIVKGEEYENAAPLQTVMIEAASLGEDDAAGEYLNALAEQEREEKKKKPDVPLVVRIYAPDGERHVRDVRTEVRTTQVQQVLDGDLDAFILALLRAADESKWDK